MSDITLHWSDTLTIRHWPNGVYTIDFVGHDDPRVGLRLKHTFRSVEAAERTMFRIQEAGRIDERHWGGFFAQPIPGLAV